MSFFILTLEMENTSKDHITWFAIRVTYSRELKFKEYLDQNSIPNFIPMHYVMVNQKGKSVRKLVPIIHNLVFVNTDKPTLEYIKQFQSANFPIRYIMGRTHHRPIIIPEKQMQDFIAVSGQYEEQIVYLDPTEVSIKKGDRVRVTGGIWRGIEGKYIRIAKDRRVVVSIEGIMAVGTAFIHPSLIEVVKEELTTK